MQSSSPNFSPFPFDRLPRITRQDAAFESVIARWVAARPLGERVARLVGGRVGIRMIGVTSERGDPHPALAEVRIGGQSITLAAASRPVRVLAQRVLGGPAELDAPRPPTTIEHAIWSLALAAAIEDSGLAAEVWPIAEPADASARMVAFAVDLAGTAMTVIAHVPPGLVLRAPPVRPIPAWTLELPIVVARCALSREAARAVAVRDVIVVEPELSLALGDGTITLSATPGAVEAVVATGYCARDMALPDDAHLELTVQLGTTRLNLRQLAELAVGQVVALGRPLAGPYEVRAAGRLVGQGELVDVDGELGVRIVSLAEADQ